MNLDPHFRAMLDAAAAIEMPPLATLPPEMIRMGYVAQRAGLDAGAPKDLTVSDIKVDGGAGPIKARLYVPKDAPATTGALVNFHGGGFVIGDLETHDDFMRRLCAASGVRVLAVDYRLAPEHPSRRPMTTPWPPPNGPSTTPPRSASIRPASPSAAAAPAATSPPAWPSNCGATPGTNWPSSCCSTRPRRWSRRPRAARTWPPAMS